MIKKGLIFLLLIFLIVFSVSAATTKISISSSKIQNKVFPGSEVTYIVTVKNNLLRNEIIKVSPDPFSIFPFSDFIDSITVKPAQIEIPTQSQDTFEVKVKYSKEIKSEKSYTAYIIVSSLLHEDIKETFPLTSYIMNSGDIVNMDVNIGDTVDLGKDVSFDVKFKNNVDQNFENLKLFISLGSFSDEEDFKINSKEEIIKTFTLNIKPETPPGDYNLVLKLFNGQSLKGERSVRVNVESNKELAEKISKENGFLSTKITITKSNKGNEKFNKIVKYPVGSFQKLFTETSPKPEFVTENDQGYYLWNLNINPGEEVNIIIDTNYTSLFLTIFGLTLLIGLIYYVRTRSLKISKKVIMVREGHDKKLHFKVIISLQNYTGKPIHNLKVIDLLPSLIKHYKEFGTLEPKHVQQGGRGLRFVWELNKLESGEERVISYKIEPQLNLFGNIRLPPAILQFTNKHNKLVMRRSNIASFKLEHNNKDKENTFDKNIHGKTN